MKPQALGMCLKTLSPDVGIGAQTYLSGVKVMVTNQRLKPLGQQGLYEEIIWT